MAIGRELASSAEAYVIKSTLQGDDKVISRLAVISDNMALAGLLKGGHRPRARTVVCGETAMPRQNMAMAGHVGTIRKDRPLRLRRAGWVMRPPLSRRNEGPLRL